MSPISASADSQMSTCEWEEEEEEVEGKRIVWL